MGEEGEGISLEHTPTWAVATVCFFLIALSILIEHALHLLSQYFSKRRRKYLIQALDKIKSDLMLLGFVSLLLTVSERPISKICIPKDVAEKFLPCQRIARDEEKESKCQIQGKVSLMSREAVQQLQILIFVLAFFHVLSSFLTFSLGLAKMRRWESWETETRSLEYQFSNDPRRIQLAHQTSFGKRHLKFWSEHRFLRLPACFLRQFYGSVYKADYFTLRHGFIVAHLTEGSDFDFQKYIRRALEKDFGVVVGMRLWIWTFSILFIFFNANEFSSNYWLPFIPLVMLLVTGTKLESIITKMCLDSKDKSSVVRGNLIVKPSDHFFWFGKPKLLLHLMHFILFQNSFQLAFFAWTRYEFGFNSCFHQETEEIVVYLAMGLIIHILCGYVTLPLYALVTQMGTSMKNAVFTEGVIIGLKRWRAKAKKNVAQRNTTYTASTSLHTSLSLDNLPSFSTLSASLSVDFDEQYGFGDEFMSVEVSDEGSVSDERRADQQGQKLESFQGFRPGKIQRNFQS